MALAIIVALQDEGYVVEVGKDKFLVL